MSRKPGLQRLADKSGVVRVAAGQAWTTPAAQVMLLWPTLTQLKQHTAWNCGHVHVPYFIEDELCEHLVKVRSLFRVSVRRK